MTSDIEKAFLQVSVDKGDRDNLRFLWFGHIFSGAPRIVRNRFARVVFGATKSPFLVNSAIRKHKGSYDFDEKFIQKVLDSYYVHDFIGGESTMEMAFELFKKLKIRFLEIGLHIWAGERKISPELPHLQTNNSPEA